METETRKNANVRTKETNDDENICSEGDEAANGGPSFLIPSHRNDKFSINYAPQKGLQRYDKTLKCFIPMRQKKTNRAAVSPVDSAGLFSTLYSTWITKYLWQAYKTSLSMTDLPEPSVYDTCNYNVQRLELLWQDELSKRGPSEASLVKVAWRFVSTRIWACIVVLIISLILGFISPTILLRKLLEYVQKPGGSTWDGVKWALLLTICDLVRQSFFAMAWILNYRTAIRLKAACVGLLYRKVIRLKCLGQKSSGEIINLFANDSQRLVDVVLFGTMIVSGPVVTICALLYVLWLFSPIALLGLLTFFLFYPFQYFVSRASAYYRRKSVTVTDGRIKLINEIFTSARFVKMYAYEKLLKERLIGIRKKEEKLLRKTAYCHSLSISLSPAVPVISSITVFLTHVSLGNNLTAAQAFPIVSVFGATMRLALSSLRDGTRYVTDALLTISRFKVFSIVSVFSALIRTTLMYTQGAFFNILEAIFSLNRLKGLTSKTTTSHDLSRCSPKFCVNCASHETFESLSMIILSFALCVISVLILDETTCQIYKPIVKSQAVAIVNGTFVYDVIEGQFGKKNNKNEKKMQRKNISPKYDGPDETVSLHPSLSEPKRVEVLTEITFEAAKGKLIGICGQVGSGKSSLLLAALGQLKMTGGQLMRDGSCAYVSQEAWIVNATLKENILFGEVFDAKRYYQALTVCCLKEDLNMLPGGDETEIGERGINLSGGQKQRVALARALYADRDIYFLDDSLSAVDNHVGTYIFENMILGALKSKAIIFVSHQAQFLKRCECIYVMNTGRIVEHGTHEDLMNSGGEYSSMIANVVAEESKNVAERKRSVNNIAHGGDGGPTTNALEPSSSSVSVESTANNGRTRGGGATLIAEEKSEAGSVKFSTYLTYVLAAGGYVVAFLVLLAFFVNLGSIAFSNWWLAQWIKAGGGNITLPGSNETMISENINDNPDFNYYRIVYGSVIIVILLTSVLRGFAITLTTINASTSLYKMVLDKILGAPMRFFETTPIGRLQNIFSRDVDEVDCYVPMVLENLLQNIIVAIVSVSFICGIFPWCLIPFFIIGFIFCYTSHIYRAGIRDFKRFESTTRSPVLSYVSTTIQGLSTIHAFKKNKDFVRKFDEQLNLNNLCQYMCNISMRWLSVRLDYLTVVSTCVTAFLVIILKNEVPAALAGLAMAYCSQISGMLQYTVRLMSDVEAKFISVERISRYIRTLETEGGDPNSVVKPPDSWPLKGRVEFQSVHMRYREELPFILIDVSFAVAAGEKIGIVGRTGSGKSSLITALFRMVEISSGTIKIDNIDISKLELGLLRNSLSIIPQDPVLFSGTVRSNLDPFKKHPDDEIWSALEKTELKEKVKLMKGQLDAFVEFGGSNLSVGERQLLCLARALLRRSKILVLDEATAAVDPETETAVQNTIRNEFPECTILTIAHRLQTVSFCDRILVMSKGRVVEFDKPANLLANDKSEYSKMIVAANEAANKD